MVVLEISVHSQTDFTESTSFFHCNNKHVNIGCAKEKAYHVAGYGCVIRLIVLLSQ